MKKKLGYILAIPVLFSVLGLQGGLPRRFVSRVITITFKWGGAFACHPFLIVRHRTDLTAIRWYAAITSPTSTDSARVHRTSRGGRFIPPASKEGM